MLYICTAAASGVPMNSIGAKGTILFLVPRLRIVLVGVELERQRDSVLALFAMDPLLCVDDLDYNRSDPIICAYAACPTAYRQVPRIERATVPQRFRRARHRNRY
jgi:hypothetical protein